MPPLPRTDRKASRSGQPACITPIHDAVTTAVLNLMEGEVVSFGDIAGKAGHPRAAGAILSKSGDNLPWWRVVYANGHLPPCHPRPQTERLMA